MPKSLLTPPLIEVLDVTKEYSFGENQILLALRGVRFSIHYGECIAIMGPSGSGKSTLMNILGCLDIPTTGQYRLDGANTACLSKQALSKYRNRYIGFVFQGFHLLPRKNILDNVALPLIYAGVNPRQRKDIALEKLDQVGLVDRAYHRPHQLSGGQQQRVAIARALATSPRLILADEPTGNLDTRTSVEIMSLFETLNREHSLTIVLVTHEPDIARYASRLIHLIDGYITYDGPTSSFLDH